MYRSDQTSRELIRKAVKINVKVCVIVMATSV